MTVDDIGGGGGFCLFSKPMMTSFVNNPLFINDVSNLSKNQKIICECERRVFAPVDEKYQMDIPLRRTGKTSNTLMS